MAIADANGNVRVRIDVLKLVEMEGHSKGSWIGGSNMQCSNVSFQ